MKERARSVSDKEERRRDILRAARRLWAKTPWSDLTMSAVAEGAGLVKGTLYLYFATKEELFLALLGELLSEYFDDLDAALSSPRIHWTKRKLADRVVAGLRGNSDFTRMLPMLGGILEHNVPFDAALALQQLLRDRFTRTGALLESRLPFLRPGEGAPLILRLSAFTTGLAHMAFPAPVTEKVLAVPGMELLRVDLAESFRQVLLTLLDGLEARGRREAGGRE